MNRIYQDSYHTQEADLRSSSLTVPFAERFCLLIICLYYFLPLAVQAIRVAGFVVILFVWLFSTARRKALYISTVFLSLLGLWIILELTIGSWLPYTESIYDRLKSSYTTLCFFIPGLIFLSYQKKREEKPARFVSNASLILLVLGIINTYLVLRMYPLASRILASGSIESNYFSKMGAGGYGYVYAIALLIPCLLYIALENKRIRILFFILTLFVIILLLKASYTIALFIGFLGVVFSLLARKKWHFYLLTVLALVTFLFITNDQIGRIMVYVANLFGEGTVLSRKFLDVSKYFLSGIIGSSSSGRLAVYLNTLDAIKQSPVFGAMTSGVDGAKHTSWPDLYATYGVFSMFPIFLHILIQKAIYETINHRYKIAYGVVLALFWFLGFFNPVHTQLVIGFTVYLLVPAMFGTFIQNSSDKTKGTE